MEAVFQWIKNITYYLLFVSLLSYLMPAGKYEQYIKLFFGAVFILLVVSPLTGGLHIEGRLAQAYARIRFTQEQEEFKQKLWGIEEKQLAQIMEQYEEAVSRDIRGMAFEEGFSCLSAGARIEKREEEENFGQVVEIVMVIGEEGTVKNQESKGEEGIEAQEDTVGKMVSIDQVKVVIGQEEKGAWDAAWKEKEEWGGEQDAGREKQEEKVKTFQRKVARYYGLEEEAVRITWEDN